MIQITKKSEPATIQTEISIYIQKTYFVNGSKLDTVTLELTLDETFKRRYFRNNAFVDKLISRGNFTYLDVVHDQALYRQSALVLESVVFVIKRASEIDSEISPSQIDGVPTGDRNSSLSIQTWYL